MPISIILGNGFSIDGFNFCKSEYNPSFPWSYSIPSPYDPNKAFIDLFPHLKKHLNKFDSIEKLSVYDVLVDVIQNSNIEIACPPHKTPTEYDWIHYESSHYLRYVYCWFEQQLDQSRFKEWGWNKWVGNNWQFIGTVLSYNYDLLFEKTLSNNSLGKVYSGSNKYFPFGTNLTPVKQEVYYESGNDIKRTIHICKPHGSSNFTSWLSQGFSENGVDLPLYPLKSMLVRATPLKIIENEFLLNPVSNSDIILPGEYSRWNYDFSTNLDWVDIQKNAFIEETKHCESLMIIGFGFGEPDKKEFKDILNRVNNFKNISVVDPTPNIDLINLLKRHCSSEVSIYHGID